MINIVGKNKQQNIRLLSDFVEPFIVKQLQKEHHTFFIYRCSEYKSFLQLCRIHRFLLKNKNVQLFALLEKYWSCIDAIHITIEDMPKYTADKKYFDTLHELCEKNKVISELKFYEIKATSGILKPVLSVKTKEFIHKLKELQLSFNIAHIIYKGSSNISIIKKPFSDKEFYLKTHCGRRNITLY